MTTRTFIVLVISLIITLIGCGKREEERIKIGAILPLTGEGAIYGERTKRGMDLALEEINREGGIGGKKLEIIYEDDRLEPKDGVNAIQKLATVDKVPIVIGPVSSGVVLAVAPIANRTKTVVLSTYASNYKITEAGDYIFRIYPSDAFQGVLDAKLAHKMGFRKAAILYVNSDYGVGLRNVFSRTFQELGGRIVAEEAFEAGKTDFRAQLAKIKAARPDVVFMPGNAKEMATILLQAKQLHLDKQFIATDSFLADTIIGIAGDAAEGVVFTTLAENKDENYQKFAKAFRERYNADGGLLESLGYDAVKLVAEVIKGGATTGEQIKDALYRIRDFPGAAGKITFDANGDVAKEFTVMKVSNRRFVNFE